MEAGKNAGLTHEPKNGAYTSGYGQETSSYPPPVGGAQYPPSGYPAQQTPQQQLPPSGAYPPPPPPNAYAVPPPQPQYAAYPPQYPAPQNAYPAQQYAPNPPVILGGAATVLDTPTNVIVGEASDSCMIQPRNTVLMVVAIVAAVGAVIAVINLIVSFSVVTLVAGIIALGIALGCAFFCHDVVIEFNKSIGTFRLMHRRFLFVLCDQRDIKLDVPFSSLGEPYAESSGPPGTGALATVWLPVQGHPNVKLAAHHYHTDVDLQRDLMVWRVYVNRFRGPVSAVSTLMHAVHGAASGLTSAIRATV